MFATIFNKSQKPKTIISKKYKKNMDEKISLIIKNAISALKEEGCQCTENNYSIKIVLGNTSRENIVSIINNEINKVFECSDSKCKFIYKIVNSNDKKSMVVLFKKEVE